MKAFKLIVIGLVISVAQASAQTGADSGTKYGVGEDSIRCVKNLSLYNEDFRNNNFDAAFPAWEVVFNECPAATVNIYIDGANMLKDKIKKNRDAAKFEELYQYLMKVHDQRLQFFGDHPRMPAPTIKGGKAIDMLTYKRDDSEVVQEAYGLLKEAITALKRSAQPAYLATFMSTSVNMYGMGQISAEDVVNNYTLISDIVEQQLKDQSKSSHHEIYEQVKAGVESLFASSGVATCDVIIKIYEPQLEDNKFDLAWLKRVSQLLARGLCEDAELLYKVSEYQHNIEPSDASAFGLARMYLKSGELDRALEYFNQAVELTDDATQKGEYLYQMAILHLSQDRYAQSRSHALRAIEARPNWGAPYILIGKAYAASANSIGSKELEKKSAYWAAVDKFMRAKSVDPSVAEEANEQISIYSAHFPAKDEVFFESLEVGATYMVGGWINERTTIRTK
jgi:tetratricopeptide (TPR) repeat protein